MDKTSYIKTNKPLYIENLDARQRMNAQFGTRDFEQWVFSHGDFPEGCSVLAIACGTGYEVIKLLELEPQIGEIVAFDFAETAIEALRTEIAARGLEKVETLVLDMENPDALAGRRFTHIYSIYGIHYSPRMAELLVAYAGLLEEGGSIFVCGPDAFSNAELMRILRGPEMPERTAIPERMLRSFISPDQLREVKPHFDSVEVDLFQNIISFRDLDAFLDWWRNHDLHSPQAEPVVLPHVEAAIAQHGSFDLNKNALGITFA